MKSSWLVRALIRLYPREFRERYGRQLLAFHAERARHARIGDWLRIIGDHLHAASAEHVRAWRAGRAAGRSVTLSTLLYDLHYAARALPRRPVFTIVVIATIALGVGANTAIFSVVHGVILRPLPYPEADRVVSFGHNEPTWLTSQPEYIDYKNGLRSFETLAAFVQTEGNLATEEEPERIGTASVTLDFFEALGVAPQLGRTFSADEDLVRPANVVVLSHSLWQRRYAADPRIVGRSIMFNGRPRTVVGVMPRNFDYPKPTTDLWLPMYRIKPDSLDHRSNHSLFMVGRIRKDVPLARARVEAVGFARNMVRDNSAFYDPNQPPIPVIARVADDLVGGTRPYLWALLGAVAFVLLIVCANVANLLLARGEGRRREMAVRSALGAARTRLASQLLAESLLLAFTGGVAGVLIATAAQRGLLALAPASLPRLDEIGISWAVLAYAFVTSLVAGILFGLVPAVRAASHAPGETLKRTGRTDHQAGSKRVRQALVVAEVALAVIMLTGAGMLLRSLANLQSTNLGFNTESVLTAKVSLSQSSYDEQRSVVFYTQLLERVRALPGVHHASAAGWLPIVDTGGLWGVLAEGMSYDKLIKGPIAAPQQVTPGYFSAMGIALLSGRDFTDADRATGPFVGIVSKSLAQQLWPDQDPLGKRFRLGGGETYVTVIGVAADVRATGFERAPEPTMYFVYPQTAAAAYFMPRSMSLVVRTSVSPLLLANQVRAIVRSLDATVPVSNIRTLEQVVGTAVASRRFSTTLIAAFATLALILAAIGTYGVISYGVTERTYEIGVRMALGAERGKALALVVGDSVRMAALGIALGLAGAAAVARAIRSMLVGVPVIDPPTLAAVTAILLAVVLAAAVVPARRAMSISPTQALRGD